MSSNQSTGPSGRNTPKINPATSTDTEGHARTSDSRAASTSSGHSRKRPAEALLQGTEKKKESSTYLRHPAANAAFTTVQDTKAPTIQESTAMAVLQSPSQAATSTASTQGAAPINTQVTVSQNFDTHTTPEKKSTPRIKRDGDFRDLVTQSTIFADQSLFIKDVIEDNDTALLLAMPRRWGRTVNLGDSWRYRLMIMAS